MESAAVVQEAGHARTYLSDGSSCMSHALMGLYR
jgi:hypothetical protein